MSAAHHRMRRLTVLIADDDPAVLRMLHNTFLDNGYDVQTARSAAVARELAARDAPDIAIVDLRLGGAWGIDLIADLKRINPRVHAVLLSGFVSVAATVDAMRAGAADVVFKPIRPSELVQRIEDGAPATDGRDDKPPSLARARFEHMSRILADCHGNVSEAARRLGVHRNTLQRVLRNVPKT